MSPATANEGNRVRSRSLNGLKERSLAKKNPSQMDGNQSSHDRSRVFWAPSQDRVLLDLMLEQVRRGRKLGNSFRKEAWKCMLAHFNRKFGLTYDVQQLKYRLKYYRNQYKVVKSLLSRGFIWDSTSHTIVANSITWESYILENPDAVRYRDKSWPYYDDWCKICDPSTTEGQIVNANPLVDLEDEVMMDNIAGAGEAGLSDTPVGSPLIFEEEFEVSQHPTDDDADNGQTDQDQHDKSSIPRLSILETQCTPRKWKTPSIHNAVNNIADAMRFKAAQRSESKQDRWPVEKCIEELNKIEGLEEELSLKALLAFRDEYNRRVFLSTKGEQQKGWLRMICG